MKRLLGLNLILCILAGCGKADKPTGPDEPQPDEHDKGTI